MKQDGGKGKIRRKSVNLLILKMQIVLPQCTPHCGSQLAESLAALHVSDRAMMWFFCRGAEHRTHSLSHIDNCNHCLAAVERQRIKIVY